MTLPQVTETILDGALGLTSGNTDNLFALVGPCTKGNVGTVYTIASVADVRQYLGYGPLAEAAALQLATAGGFLYAVPGIVTAGSTGAIVASRSGAPSVSVESLLGMPGDELAAAATNTGRGSISFDSSSTGIVASAIEVDINGTGGLGSATMNVKLGGTTVAATVAVPSTTYAVPSSNGVVLDFSLPAGGQFKSGDSFVFEPGPHDGYDVVMQVVTTGALGAMQFIASLDGGETFGQIVNTPAGAASAGTVTSSAGPFAIAPSEHWDVQVNGGTSQVFTFASTPASVTGSASPSFTPGAGSLVMTVNGSPLTITFSTEATELACIDTINAAIVGAGLSAFASDAGGALELQSGQFGTGSTMNVMSTSASGVLTALGLTVGTATGTASINGNAVTIANLAAATAAELAGVGVGLNLTAVGGVTGGTITALGSQLVVSTNTAGPAPDGVQVMSTSTTSLGFDNAMHPGGSTFAFNLTESDGTYTGVTLLIPSGSYLAGDNWSCSCTGPCCSKAAVTDPSTGALTYLFNAQGVAFSMVHVVANPPSWGDGSVGAEVIAESVNSLLQTQQTTAFEYVSAVVDGPNAAPSGGVWPTGTGPTDAASALSPGGTPVSCLWTAVTGGADQVVSALTGRFDQRPVGSVLMARLASVDVQESPAFVGRGALVDVNQGYVNDSDATAFDNARVITSRAFRGLAGAFITRGITLAGPGSDYARIMNVRVMMKACTIVRAALLPYLNSQVATNSNGTISSQAASTIESDVNGKLRDQLVTPGNAVTASVQVNRTQNVLSSGVLPVSIRVQPFGYAEQITVDIGFQAVP